MKKNIQILLLLLAGVFFLQSCALFPGFSIHAIGKSAVNAGTWNHTDNFVSPMATLSSPAEKDKIFDLNVSSRNGDVMVSYVDSNLVRVFLKASGNPIADFSAGLGNFTFSSGIVGGFDCSYPYDRPLVAIYGSGNIVMGLDVNSWNTNTVFTSDTSKAFNFDLIENENNQVSFLNGSNNMQMVNYFSDYNTNFYTNKYIGFSSFDYARVFANGNFDNRNNIGIGVAVVATNTLSLLHYDNANGWTNYYHIMSIPEYANPTNFRSIFMGPGDGNFTNYNFFEDNENFAVLERVSGNYMSGPVNRHLISRLSDGAQPVRGLDACFDWNNRYLYLAYIDNDGIVYVFKYLQGSNVSPLPVANELDLNADRVKIRVRDGHLYLAVLRRDRYIELWDYQD